MSSKIVPRDVSSLLQKLRKAFFFGREVQSNLRFEGQIAKRSIPQPNLPGGLAHRSSQNYYFNRDARRTHKPNETIFIAGSSPSTKLIEENKEKK